MIPYGRQDINEDDINAVIDVLRSDFLTQGPTVPKFEEMVSQYCGAKHSLAMNSATSALHVACLALGLGEGDVLWTVPVTFVASANCALYCGASVDFVDIDPNTFTMCPLALEKKLSEAKASGKLPKIVIPVHLCGQSADMEAIKKLSIKYGFKIIEDASHAIGARYKSKPVGSCEYSDICIFSFHPVKIITTAEGGMLLTNDSAIAGKANLLRSHGITRDPELMTHAPDGPWYYQQVTLGFNYRMTDLQAALGCSQMSRLDDLVKTRHELVSVYNEKLSELPIRPPHQHQDCYSSFHLYVIRVKATEISKSHLDLFNDLREKDIGVNLHYIPVHLQPYYRELGFSDGSFPEAEQYYKEAITLPLHPNLSAGDQDYVISAIRESLSS